MANITSDDKVEVKTLISRDLALRVRAAALADHRSIAGWVRHTLDTVTAETDTERTAPRNE